MKDVLWSAIVAAGISGVLIFSYQQWLQTRIKRIENELQRQRAYQQQSHDTLVTAYAKIWTGLVEIEDWLIHKMWKEIEGAEVVDPQRWTVVFDLYKSFRSEMLFLPDAMYDRTLALINELEANLNRMLDVLRMIIVEKEADPEGYSTNPRLLSLMNDALERVRGGYRAGLEELRRDYQAISRDLLLGDFLPALEARTQVDDHRSPADAASAAP